MRPILVVIGNSILHGYTTNEGIYLETVIIMPQVLTNKSIPHITMKINDSRNPIVQSSVLYDIFMEGITKNSLSEEFFNSTDTMIIVEDIGGNFIFERSSYDFDVNTQDGIERVLEKSMASANKHNSRYLMK